MAISGRQIRARIKSVKNTKKITKAMELVSAAKMRRAVAAALQSRQYARHAWDLLLRLQTEGEGETVARHPLFADRPVKKMLIVAVTSNRGLAGAFNANVVKKAVEQLHLSATPEVDFIVVGKRGEQALRKFSSRIVASFIETPDVPGFADVQALIRMATEGYAKGQYDKVVVVYTHFVSGLVQQTQVRQVLPVIPAEAEKAVSGVAASKPQGFVQFEPSVEEIITVAVTRLIESQVFQSILESAASEHSARMMSMRQATDAATDMIDSLTLVFNQARQASITKEISEISAGKAALE